MVSRAFQILSDEEKKAKYDKFGGDPDNRFSGGASASSPFSGFGGGGFPRRPGGRGPMYEEEISPEELFNRFFGGGGMGGMGGGFGPFGKNNLSSDNWWKFANGYQVVECLILGHSLSLTWVVVLESACINLAEPGHEDGPGKQTNNLRSKLPGQA